MVYHHSTANTDLSALLHWLGLEFDPFSYLNAGVDPNLSDYLVGYQIEDTPISETLTLALKAAWGDWPTYIFAPVGGGKSALRVYISQTCFRQEANRPFSITYEPPFLSWLTVTPTVDQHLAALAEAGAEQLFLALAFRPHWFLRLHRNNQQYLHAFLSSALSGPLDFRLEELKESLKPDPGSNPTFSPLDKPAPEIVAEFCNVLAGCGSLTPQLMPSATERWAALTDILLNVLNFRSVYILVDGLDATPDTANNPSQIITCMSPLFSLFSKWEAERIFVKGFMPEETQPLLETQFPQVINRARTANIYWTPQLLVEVIRRRLYVASRGEFNSLDAITSPALRDVEWILVENMPPLPREIMVITRQLFIEHIKYRGSTGKIEERDVQAALHAVKNLVEEGTYA